MELRKLKPYRITKGNTDGNIIPGVLIWQSENGMLNICDKYGGGFLNGDELTPEMMDFEADIDNDYEIVVTSRSEQIIKRSK